MRIDDVMEKYIFPYNPLHGPIIADTLLVNTALALRDRYWSDNFAALPRTPISIKDAGNIFWTFFLKYALPTAQEYFGWCRELLLNIACFEKLLNIKAEGIRDIETIARIMNELAHFLGHKQWKFDLQGGNEYAKLLQQNPPVAYNFILSLYPKSHPHRLLELEKCEAAQRLLHILRDCNVEVINRLRQANYNTLLQESKVGADFGRNFTKTEMFTKCRSTIMGPDFIGGTPNPNVRYPELCMIRWEDFQDRHMFLRDDDGEGPLIELLRAVPPESPKTAILNEFLYYSKCIGRDLEGIMDEVIDIRIKQGFPAAMKHALHRHKSRNFLPELQDEYITAFNYNVALGILLGDPIPLERMDVDAGPAAPLQKAKKNKPEKKKAEADSYVFWLVGLGALLLAMGTL